MNIVQQKLLDLARVQDIESIRRVDLVKMIGCDYPSQITHHLKQLVKKGDLVRKDGRLVPAIGIVSSMMRIPIMGEADCGEATKFADGRMVDVLTVSPSIINARRTDTIYALIAKGDSMNRAVVAGKEIHNGDYVIVEKDDTYVPNDGDVVVSIIGGLANIKRFRRDEANRRIVLLSDSYRQSDFAPIIVSDLDDFRVEGRVIDVVKAVV